MLLFALWGLANRQSLFRLSLADRCRPIRKSKRTKRALSVWSPIWYATVGYYCCALRWSLFALVSVRKAGVSVPSLSASMRAAQHRARSDEDFVSAHATSAQRVRAVGGARMWRGARVKWTVVVTVVEEILSGHHWERRTSRHAKRRRGGGQQCRAHHLAHRTIIVAAHSSPCASSSAGSSASTTRCDSFACNRC
jgi:hypothetical protein